MQKIADLHVHSRYSRATSKALGIAGICKAAKKKGINIMATGDFTHPLYFNELKEELVPLGTGFYRHKDDIADGVKFMLTQEISSIYKRHGKVRRIHNLITAPSLEVVEKINGKLGEIGNLKADGRPILGLDSEELLKIILDISQDCMLIPCHIWTPWFSMFGSKSGFDSIEECFGEMSKHIYAIESGLSSDPLMNWMVSGLDNVAIISNGDAHSSANLAREANVFELSQVSYANLIQAIKNSRQLDKNNLPPDYLKYTIEFFAQEGKYHFDGHRDCKVVMHPKDTKKEKGICPKCKKPMTIGVMNRVYELADRSEEEAMEFGRLHKAPFKSFVPLREIISDAFGVGKASKKVSAAYEDIVMRGNSELNVLIEFDFDELDPFARHEIAEGIKRVREGKIFVEPGYDGVYGVVKVFKQEERERKSAQRTLF